MSLWGARRRAIVITIVLSVTILIIGITSFIIFYEDPNCFDGSRNGNEEGVDCGGGCELRCDFETYDLSVLWKRFFEIVPGQYNLIAYVENQNFDSEVRSADYVFRLIDENNRLIAERRGNTNIKPQSTTPIVENAVDTGGAIPRRVEFEFVGDIVFHDQLPQEKIIVISDEQLIDRERDPRVSAVLTNLSVKPVTNLEAVAIVYNKSGNAIGSSSTFVETIPKDQSAPIFFTWPKGFERDLEACSAPTDVVVLMDTSGSMNNDGDNPPQPITTAKGAAADFVSSFGESDTTAVITFATQSNILQQLTANHQATKAVLENVEILPEEETGFTNLGDAILDGTTLLSGSSRSKQIGGTTLEVRKAIVLLTDGLANFPRDPGGEPYAEEKANLAKRDGVEIYTIGLGDKVNTEFLEGIASTPSNYYQAATRGELAGIYSDISDAICESGPGVLEIVPLYDDPK
jgi:Mg-chelatase subunit ChlD